MKKKKPKTFLESLKERDPEYYKWRKKHPPVPWRKDTASTFLLTIGTKFKTPKVYSESLLKHLEEKNIITRKGRINRLTKESIAVLTQLQPKGAKWSELAEKYQHLEHIMDEKRKGEKCIMAILFLLKEFR